MTLVGWTFLGVKKLRDASPCMPTIVKPCMHKITQNRSDGLDRLGGEKVEGRQPMHAHYFETLHAQNHTKQIWWLDRLGGEQVEGNQPMHRCQHMHRCQPAKTLDWGGNTLEINDDGEKGMDMKRKGDGHDEKGDGHDEKRGWTWRAKGMDMTRKGDEHDDDTNREVWEAILACEDVLDRTKADALLSRYCEARHAEIDSCFIMCQGLLEEGVEGWGYWGTCSKRPGVFICLPYICFMFPLATISFV